MKFPINQLGQGAVCPSLPIRNNLLIKLLLLILLLIGTTNTYSQSPNLQATVLLSATPDDYSSVTVVHSLAQHPEFAETWLSVDLQAGNEVLTVTLGGLPHSVPPGMEIGRLSVDIAGSSYDYVLISDGGTVMIVIDDF